MKRLSAAELVSAHAARNWSVLWQQGLPLVPVILTVAARRGKGNPDFLNEDATQQASLLVGEAVRAWRPPEGSFGTWIVASCVGPMLNWFRVQANRGIGSHKMRSTLIDLHASDWHSPGSDEPEVEYSGIESLTYVDPPMGFDDPAVEADRLQAVESLTAALNGLEPEDRRVVLAYYGLDGRPETELDVIARRAGESSRTVWRRLAAAREALWRELKEEW